MMLTKEQIEALRDGATEGPWTAGPHDDPEIATMVWYVFGPAGSIIIEIDDDDADNVVATAIGSGARPENVEANAQLIAAVHIIADTALDALARLEKAEAEQALVVERAAEVARRHHSKVQINEPLWHDGQDWASDRIAEAIEALADPSGVEALAALRAEQDRINQWRETAIVERDTYSEERDVALTRLAAAEAQVAGLVGALRKHHEWHLSQDRDGNSWGIDPVDAYSESGLCEETCAALATQGTGKGGCSDV